MKKHYTLTLDDEKVDELKTYLERNGQTLSGYLNLMIEENLQVLKLYAPKGDKVRFSFFDLLSMAGDMHEKLKKEANK